MFEGEVLSFRRYLDMEHGYTVRKVRWRSPKGNTVRIVSKRMTSFEQLTLFTIVYQVESEDYEGELSIVSTARGMRDTISGIRKCIYSRSSP